MAHPELLIEYLNFCKHKQWYVDPAAPKFESLSPTMLLPLQDWVLNKTTDPNITKLFDPTVTNIPVDSRFGNRTFQEIMGKYNSKNFGGENVFAYLIAELTDNIYEHSKFSNGLLLGRENSSFGYSDLSIFDNGITILGSFHNHGMMGFDESEAIVRAINGLSSKQSTERGHGLGSTFRLVINGLRGQLLIVSGAGAIFISPDKKIQYNVTQKNRLEGTLVSIRAPRPPGDLDIFDYV